MLIEWIVAQTCQVFINNPQGNRLRDDQKTDGGTVYKKILIDAKLKTEKTGQKSELTGRSPLRRLRSRIGL
jgi:hypothetical protein